MTPAEAEDLAARTFAAMDTWLTKNASPWHAANRERVESDLAGLRLTDGMAGQVRHDLRRIFADNLLRTAALYSVTAPTPNAVST